MKVILLALSATFCYAIYNLVLEKRLAKISPMANVLFLILSMLIAITIALPFRSKLGIAMTDLPKGSDWLVILLTGFLILLGDLLFYAAYNFEGSLTTITPIVIMMPVFACAMKMVWDGTKPTAHHIVGWIMAAGAVLIISQAKNPSPS